MARTAGLAEEFPPASLEEWRAAAQARSGAPKTFSSTLEGGIPVAWLYTAQDALAPDPGGLPGASPYVRGTRTGQPWAIRQECATPTRAAANAQILEDLEGGATEVILRVDPTGKRGVPVTSVDDLDEVLAGVYPELAPVALDAVSGAPAAAAALASLWSRRGLEPAELRGSLRLDPIGALARPGADADEIRGVISEATSIFASVRLKFPSVHVFSVDTAPYVDAGASASFELALATATAIAYLRAGDAGGIAPADLAAGLEFTLISGPDQFLEIAKLRAARRLWAAALEHCGVAPHACRSRTYARTSRRMVSSLDPWVNLLRATTAAFAGGVGGADGLTVLPFDEAVGETVGEPGPLARRIARNTQHVLIEEASLHRVADPAGGSWYVESLTDAIARQAWSELQAIERTGGIVEALRDGLIQERLADASHRRHEEIAHRRRALTGVNTFPLLGDDGLARSEPRHPAPDGVADGGLVADRDAAAFEHLRARASALTNAGQPPTILLACMGPLSAHVNLALWAKGFFESGGIATISSAPRPDDTAQAVLLREHGLNAAVICPARGVPTEAQAALATALRHAGATMVYLAGADDEGAAAVGADQAVHEGVDMVAILNDALDHLGGGTATR
jgi:methylmalonyl-CoA mutase